MKSVRKIFLYEPDKSKESETCCDSENRLLAEFSIDKLVSQLVSDDKQLECLSKDFYFYGGGWQSWGFGGELEPAAFEKKYFPLVPQFKNYINFPGKAPSKILGLKSSSKKLLSGCFIIYLRWGSIYLCLASVANENEKGSELSLSNLQQLVMHKVTTREEDPTKSVQSPLQLKHLIKLERLV